MIGNHPTDFVGPNDERPERLEELIGRFSAKSAEAPPPGLWRDPLGVLTRCSFRRGWEERSGKQVDSIDPALRLEWFAMLRALEEAEQDFCMLELGAGYGPWLMRAAAAWRNGKGGPGLDLLAVEGEPSHVAFLRQHAADNGVSEDCLTVFEGAVAPEGGSLRFELANDPAGDWGTRISDAQARPDLPRVPNPAEIELTAFTLADLIEDRPRVDFLHVDIQGSEVEVLAAQRDLLAARVRRILVGTHGRAIDGELLALLPDLGFRLMAEEACRYRLGGGQSVLVADGAQYWVNSRV